MKIFKAEQQFHSRMTKRKITIELEMDDDKINSIEDLEKEILALNTAEQIAEKYLYSLQNKALQKTAVRKGSKKIHIKTTRFQFAFQAKRTLDEGGKKPS